MIYHAKNFRHLLGMKGLSTKLLENHFALYEGYVKNANQMISTLDQLTEESKSEGLEFAELKRRLPFELDGIKLHELYFENMSQNPSPIDKGGHFYTKVAEKFGSFDKWDKSFRDVANIRGVGWEVVVYDPAVDMIFNTWVELHHVGLVAGTVPLLIMDLWEHAMLLDYGSKRKDYVDAFVHAIDWNVIEQRFSTVRNHVHA